MGKRKFAIAFILLSLLLVSSVFSAPATARKEVELTAPVNMYEIHQGYGVTFKFNASSNASITKATLITNWTGTTLTANVTNTSQVLNVTEYTFETIYGIPAGVWGWNINLTDSDLYNGTYAVKNFTLIVIRTSPLQRTILDLTDLVNSVGSHFIPAVTSLATNIVPLVIIMVTIVMVVMFWKEISAFLTGLFQNILSRFNL